MSIVRTIICDCCGSLQAEPAADAGFRGWAGLHGVILDGVPDPKFCPDCLSLIMQFIEARKAQLKG